MFVPKFAKFLFIALATLLAIFALLSIGVNLYLQSPAVQERMRAATEAAFGVPTQFRGAWYTPWTGFVLKSITSFDPAPPPGANPVLFEAAALHFRVALLPLLSHKVVVTSVTLESPFLRIPAHFKKFALPETRREFKSATSPVPVPESPPAEQAPELVSTPGPAIADAPAPAGTPAVGSPPPVPKTTPSLFTVEIHRFDVRNGAVLVEHAPDRPRVEATDLQIVTQIDSETRQSGSVRIGTITIENRVRFANVDARFQRDENRFEVPDLHCQWAGGTMEGNFFTDSKSGELAIQAKLANVQIPLLLTDAGIAPGRSSGHLDGSFSIAGPANQPEELKGKGNFSLKGGALEPAPFIRQFGELLGIAELQFLELDQAELNAKLSNGSISITGLNLRTRNVAILGTGTIAMDGALDLQNRLMLREEILERMGGLFNRQFSASETGFREVTFRVSGTLSNPRTDLLEKVTGIQIDKEINRILNLFGAPKKQK
jgi:type II secretion system protein N